MSDKDEVLAGLQERVGQRVGPGEWLTVDQARVDLFADATEDHQWIHVDVERAKAGPFGGPIAHGYLSVSLIPHLAGPLRPTGPWKAGINYGSDKVRFPQPLPVGTRVRAFATLLEATTHPAGIMTKTRVEVEGEGLPKPVCVAEALALLLL